MCVPQMTAEVPDWDVPMVRGIFSTRLLVLDDNNFGTKVYHQEPWRDRRPIRTSLREQVLRACGGHSTTDSVDVKRRSATNCRRDGWFRHQLWMIRRKDWAQ